MRLFNHFDVNSATSKIFDCLTCKLTAVMLIAIQKN